MKIILVQNYFLEKLKKPKIKNSIILIGVLLPALQALYFIHLFGVNIPWRDDFSMAETFHLFFSNDPYWLESVFERHNVHRMFFPQLIFLVNAFLTSWDLKVQMFLSWAFIGISLIPLYLLLNKTHSNFRWLIIPFSIIMYSPGQWQNLLWGFQLQWFLAITCIFWTIYLINLGGKFNFFISIGLGIIASFSLVHGLFIWPVGILSILFWKQKIKYLAIWISTSALVFFIYFFNFTLPKKREIILSSENIDQFFAYVFTFLGSGLSSNIFLEFTVGLVFFSTIFVSILVFRKERKKISTLVPWIQLGLVGFLASLITAVGFQSSGITSAEASRYITISNLFVISSIVMLILIFVMINNHFRKKEVKVVITASVIFIFITGGVLMNSVYLEGWERGKIEHTKRIDALSCFSIPMKTERCNDLYPVTAQSRLFKLVNLLLNLNLSPFSYLDLDFIRGNDPFFDKKNWKPLNENIQIFGKIETVNDENVANMSRIDINKSTVNIDGWILDQNKKTVDKFYLFVNDEPFLRFDNYPRLPGIDGSYRDHFEGTMKKLWDKKPFLQKRFPEVENNNYSEFEVWVRNKEPPSLKEFIFGTFVPRPDVEESLGSGSDLNSGWKLQFFTNYLEEGCHKLSIGIISNSEKDLIDSPAQICVEYKYPFIRK